MVSSTLALILLVATSLQALADDESPFEKAVRLGYDHYSYDHTEKKILENDAVLKPHCPEAKLLAIAEPTPKLLQNSLNAVIAEQASVLLTGYMNEGCLYHGDQQCARKVSDFSLSDTTLGPFCKAEFDIKCPWNVKYRSADGSCTNYRFPSQGKSGTAYTRVLPSNYYLGIKDMQPDEPRFIGGLPSPRVVSSKVSTPSGQEEHQVTLALPVWAQFVANDIAFTTSLKMVKRKSPIMCCDRDRGSALSYNQHEFCAPIYVPQNDSVYSQEHITCMHYVRSMPAFNPNCTFGPIQQVNQATHFLDGSAIYGSTSEEATSLRKLYDGLLRTNLAADTDNLPLASSDYADECPGTCVASGDARVNENVQLAALHTILLREHNRIARELAAHNRSFTDEILYQEARRIVIAEIQHITYNEFLPALLGDKLAQEINTGSYNQSVSAEVNNEVAVAALRFFTSLIQQEIKLIDNAGKVEKELHLSDTFFNPHLLDSSKTMDGILRGLATQASQKMDIGIVSDLTSKYLATPGKLGLDTLSLDIQRGRDHGFPNYNKYREHCGLPPITSFFDIRNIESDDVDKLRAVYTNVNSIDLLVGGLAEKPENGILGKTFSCLIADQFKRTRQGDRFFYDNTKDHPYPLTCGERTQVQRTTLAKLICRHASDIVSIQANVFKKVGPGNEFRPCSEIIAEKPIIC